MDFLKRRAKIPATSRADRLDGPIIAGSDVGNLISGTLNSCRSKRAVTTKLGAVLAIFVAILTQARTSALLDEASAGFIY